MTEVKIADTTLLPVTLSLDRRTTLGPMADAPGQQDDRISLGRPTVVPLDVSTVDADARVFLEGRPSAASGYVCLGDDAAESFVVGVVVAPDDVPADHAGLFLMAGVVGAVEREVAQRRELRLYAV